MIRSLLFLAFFCFTLLAEGNGQSFIFGPKIGPSFALQTWNGFDRNVMIRYHAGAYIESYTEGSPSSLYGQISFHKRGSLERGRITITGFGTDAFTSRQTFEFNNLAFILGARRIIDMEKKYKPYYILGIRGEYTINTNLDRYLQFNGYYPVDPFVNKINYGFTVGGGFQWDLSEFVGGVLELSISPDLSKQYEQPPLTNVISPYQGGQTRNLNMQEIRNISFEISLGLRLLRLVEYVD